MKRASLSVFNFVDAVRGFGTLDVPDWCQSTHQSGTPGTIQARSQKGD
jgi:hypothetical protein